LSQIQGSIQSVGEQNVHGSLRNQVPQLSREGLEYQNIRIVPAARFNSCTNSQHGLSDHSLQATQLVEKENKLVIFSKRASVHEQSRNQSVNSQTPIDARQVAQGADTSEQSSPFPSNLEELSPPKEPRCFGNENTSANSAQLMNTEIMMNDQPTNKTSEEILRNNEQIAKLNK